MVEIAQSGCEVFIIEDTHDPMEDSPGQPDVADPT